MQNTNLMLDGMSLISTAADSKALYQPSKGKFESPSTEPLSILGTTFELELDEIIAAICDINRKAAIDLETPPTADSFSSLTASLMIAEKTFISSGDDLFNELLGGGFTRGSLVVFSGAKQEKMEKMFETIEAVHPAPSSSNTPKSNRKFLHLDMEQQIDQLFTYHSDNYEGFKHSFNGVEVLMLSNVDGSSYGRWSEGIYDTGISRMLRELRQMAALENICICIASNDLKSTRKAEWRLHSSVMQVDVVVNISNIGKLDVIKNRYASPQSKVECYFDHQFNMFDDIPANCYREGTPEFLEE